MGTSESNGEEGAALLRRWRGKLTDEELNGPGGRACLRGRLAPDISNIPPACGRIFFNSARGGACWCTRGRARSPRPWRCRAFGEAGMSGFTGRIRDSTAVGITGCLLEVFLRAGFALCPAARLAVGWAVRGSMKVTACSGGCSMAGGTPALHALRWLAGRWPDRLLAQGLFTGELWYL